MTLLSFLHRLQVADVDDKSALAIAFCKVVARMDPAIERFHS